MDNNIALLVLYNLIFFRRFYANPFMMATADLPSMWFPFVWYSKWRVILKCDVYVPYPACMPFFSSFYPTDRIIGFLTKFFDMDTSFRIYAYNVLLHYLLGSILAYFGLLRFGSNVALLGAVTLAYGGCFIRPLFPAFVYSHAWMLGALIGGKFGAFCLGMSILGGYWATLAYVFPFLVIMHPEILWGVLLGLPQIIPTVWYWPKSIRHKQKHDNTWGFVPWWRYIDLIFPDIYRGFISRLQYYESCMYMGLLIFFVPFAGWSWWWIPLILSFFWRIQRIRARSLYLFCFSVVMISQNVISNSVAFPLFLIQCYLLLSNSTIFPHHPIAEWWKKPSEFFGTYIRSVKWPYFTGFMFGKHHMWYEGGFRLVRQPE